MSANHHPHRYIRIGWVYGVVGKIYRGSGRETGLGDVGDAKILFSQPTVDLTQNNILLLWVTAYGFCICALQTKLTWPRIPLNKVLEGP